MDTDKQGYRKGGFSTGGIWNRRDAGQDRTEQMQERRDVGLEGCRKMRMQERTDAGNEE